MCAIMLPDGRWTHVPASAAGFKTPLRGSSTSRAPSGVRSAAGATPSGLRSAAGATPSGLRSAAGASRNPLRVHEHPDDTGAVALVVALDAHREPLLLEQ